MASWGLPWLIYSHFAQCLMVYLRRGEGGPPTSSHPSQGHHWGLLVLVIQDFVADQIIVLVVILIQDLWHPVPWLVHHPSHVTFGPL